MDRFGARPPLAVMLSVFAAGTLVAGLAPTMLAFVLGRVLQGAGAGAQYAVGLSAVAKTYPEEQRPRVLALLAAAWILPGLAGPSFGALLATTVGWRWAFLTLLPLLVVASWLVFPGLANVRPSERRGSIGLRPPMQLAAGSAAILIGLTEISVWSVAFIAAGALLAVPALREMVRSGEGRTGSLAGPLVAGFLLSFAFFAVDGFVPLLLTHVRGESVAVASVVVTLATVSWSSGSWWQSRLAARRSPVTLVGAGAATIAVGAIGVAVSLWAIPVLVAYAAWAVAGLGMGVAYPTVYVVTMERAPAGNEGSAVALMLLLDSLGVAVGTGVGGSGIAVARSFGAALEVGLLIAFATAVVAALGAVVASRRLAPALPAHRDGSKNNLD